MFKFPSSSYFKFEGNKRSLERQEKRNERLDRRGTDNSHSKVDLVPLGDVVSASRSQVVHQTAFAHELRHQIHVLVLDHKSHQLHQIVVPQ